MSKPIATRRVSDWYNRRRVLRVGDVCRILEMASRTVQKYCDRGLIRCHRLPNTVRPDAPGDRRIYASDLIDFIRERNLPIPTADLTGGAPILWCGVGPLTDVDGFRSVTATTPYRVGRMVERLDPVCVVLSCTGLGTDTVVGLVDDLGRDRRRPLIVVLPTEDDARNVNDWRLVGATSSCPQNPEDVRRVLLNYLFNAPARTNGVCANGNGA